jgi:hypothetical protein
MTAAIVAAVFVIGYPLLVVHIARSIKPRDISDEELDRYVEEHQ